MLKLSKKWTYAVKAMIYIATSHKELVHVSDIAKDECISESLLRRIIADLDRSELLETVKWRNGGVKLRKKTQHISLFQILDASWEELGISECSKWNDCDNHENCTTTQLFWQLQTGFNSLLKMYTLDKIIKKS